LLFSCVARRGRCGCWGDAGTGTNGVIPVVSEEQAKTVPFASRYMKYSKGRQGPCTAEQVLHQVLDPRDDIDPEKLGYKMGKVGQSSGILDGGSTNLSVRRLLSQFYMPRGSLIQIFSATEQWVVGFHSRSCLMDLARQSFVITVLLPVGTIYRWSPLDEEYWHVTKYYENIRSKVKNLRQVCGQML
jgi:hypothetical protein